MKYILAIIVCGLWWPCLVFSQAPPRVFVESAEVFFDFGKAGLRPEADSTLLRIAAKCRGKDDILIDIVAHTDSIGTLKNNQLLSQKRAATIKAFLVENGVDSMAIGFRFLGETAPAATNADDEGRQRNRRATVEVFRQVPFVTIEGTVVDEKTGLPLSATVVIHSKDGRDSLLTDAQGFFSAKLPKGKVVGIDVFAKCYFLKTEMVKAMPGLAPLHYPLKPALTGEKMDIGNLFYVGGQAVLLEKSLPELPKILRFMEVNPQMKIEIAGHVNFPNRPPVTKESAEYLLSLNRAKLVHDYLLKNGIAQDRIRFQGYGNWQMKYPNAVLESDQAQNRRVEIRVLEDGCD